MPQTGCGTTWSTVPQKTGEARQHQLGPVARSSAATCQFRAQARTRTLALHQTSVSHPTRRTSEEGDGATPLRMMHIGGLRSSKCMRGKAGETQPPPSALLKDSATRERTKSTRATVGNLAIRRRGPGGHGFLSAPRTNLRSRYWATRGCAKPTRATDAGSSEVRTVTANEEAESFPE